MENNLPSRRAINVENTGVVGIARQRARHRSRPDRIRGDLYEQVFQRSNDAIILLEVDSLEVIEVNAKAENLYGYTRDEMIGMSIVDFIPNYLHDDVQRDADAMGNGLETLRFTDRPRLRKDGSEMRVHVSASTIEYNGRLIVQDVTRDETQRIHREGSLRDHADRLSTLNSQLQDEIERSTVSVKRLKALSMTDSLTGLANRRAFDERFESEWRRAVRSADSLSVAVIDVDHFKKVNDTYGHLVGDKLLVAIAERLESLCQRAGDFVARFGGEEFVALTSNHVGEGATTWCDMLREAVSEIEFDHDGCQISVTVSIGLSSMRPVRKQSRFALLETADEALYAAKAAGRNRVIAKHADALGDGSVVTVEQEACRVRALRKSGLLDTPPEARFDRITRLAARIFDVPIALVSLVDADRQWFKSAVGLACKETAREVSICEHAIQNESMTIVPDARLDARFSSSPLVTGEPFIRFYAGCPIWSDDGYRVGTLCMIDTKPREFVEQDIDTLHDLASIVTHEFQASGPQK